MQNKENLNANVVGANCIRPHFKGMPQNKEKGITLIALIITIIVMLILVGVTINVALNGGLFEKAKTASVGVEKQAIYDQILAAMTITDNGKIDPLSTYNEVEKILVAQGKTVTKTEETDSKIVFSVDDKYTYTITENKITEGEINELGGYYLNLIKVAYGMIEATDEEIDAAQEEMWELMDTGNEFELMSENEMCFIINKYYYYASMDNPELRLLDENSSEYKKYNAIFNELVDIEEKLNELLIGYTFTEDNWSKEEFETYIENNIERTGVEVYDKDFDINGLDIRSSIDESIVFLYSIDTSKQDSSYKIESIKNSNQGGF